MTHQLIFLIKSNMYKNYLHKNEYNDALKQNKNNKQLQWQDYIT